MSRFRGPFAAKSGVLVVKRGFGAAAKGDKVALVFQALTTYTSRTWNVTNTINLAS